MAAAQGEAESLREQLSEVSGERVRLEAKVAKHKQVRVGWVGGKNLGLPDPLLSCLAWPPGRLSLLDRSSSPRPLSLPQDVDEVEERLRSKAAEMEAANAAAEAAAERLEASEARERDLYEENKRLSAHISVRGGGGGGGGEPADGQALELDARASPQL